MIRTSLVDMPNIGTPFESWRDENVIAPQKTVGPIKRVLARQVTAAMAEEGLAKTEMARRMGISRGALNRLLDANTESVALTTLQKAAAVVGREVLLDLV